MKPKDLIKQGEPRKEAFTAARTASAVIFKPRASCAPCTVWGEGLDANALEQMQNACDLPVAVAGALMPAPCSKHSVRIAASV